MQLPEELIQHLVDPETHEPVHPATDPELQALRAAIKDGRARRRDGGELPASFEGAFLTEDGRRAYLVLDGIANFLIDERVELDVPVRPSP